MKKLWIICCLVLICAIPLSATTTRTLSDRVDAAGVERVILEGGVGDIEVLVTDEESIDFVVLLKPRRGGIFSSKRRAEREVQEATLKIDLSGPRLYLKVESESRERRFEETWTIELPQRMAMEIEHGVGDIEIEGLSGGLELETGVGDIDVSIGGGDVVVDVGVGDVMVEAPAAAYGHAECATGVGSARLRVQGKRIGDGGFLGNSVSWSGNGRFELSVDVGVGEADVTLD